MDVLWRIDQLSKHVANVLEVAECGQLSARITDFPDVRTIRYYTTLGLIDHPSEMRGRVAFYGQKHLLQLVAIKRLQAQGLSLVQIQQRLAGQTEAGLAEIAIPPPQAGGDHVGVPPSGGNSEPANAGTPTTRAKSFWAAAPQWEQESPAADELAPRPSVLVPVCEGVSLLVEGQLASRLNAATLQQLRPAFHIIQEALRDKQP